MASQRQIIFVCVENAGRSQMAQAFAEQLDLKAASAGTHPSPKVKATVVEVMKEKGIDLSSHSPKMLTPEMISQSRPSRNYGLFGRRALPSAHAGSNAEEARRLEPRGSPG